MGNLINYRLSQISHGWSALVYRLARPQHRLNPTSMKIFSVIARHQPISPGELMNRTALDSPKVARAVRTLTDQGLIARAPDPLDRRRAVLTVTPAGAQVFEDVDRAARQAEERLMASLTAAERASLQVILNKLELALQQQPWYVVPPMAAAKLPDETPADRRGTDAR